MTSIKHGKYIATSISEHSGHYGTIKKYRYVGDVLVGSLVGEELDEIHHVIELVLLGLDP